MAAKKLFPDNDCSPVLQLTDWRRAGIAQGVFSLEVNRDIQAEWAEKGTVLEGKILRVP